MESKEELKQAFDRFYMEKLYGSFGELEGMRRKYLQRFWLLAALSFLIVPGHRFYRLCHAMGSGRVYFRHRFDDCDSAEPNQLIPPIYQKRHNERFYGIF